MTTTLTLTAPNPTVVRLRVTRTGGLNAGTLSVGGGPPASVDAFAATSFVNVPVDAGGTDVEMSIMLSSFNVETHFDVSFDPRGELELSQEGVSCGPSLSAAAAVGTPPPFSGVPDSIAVELDVTNSPLWPASLFVVGTQSLAQPLAPAGCLLQTDILASFPVTLAPGGMASLSVPVSSMVDPITVRFQYVVGRIAGGLLEVQTSDVVQVEVF